MVPAATGAARFVDQRPLVSAWPPAVDAALLAELHRAITTAVDGDLLCAAACADPAVQTFAAGPGPLAVLALGKAAPAMLSGCRRILPAATTGPALVIAPPSSRASTLVEGTRVVIAEHPRPGAGSLAAGRAAHRLVSTLAAPARLLVLLSGGGSSLAALPADGLTLDDKRGATAAVAGAGADIFQLNAVRKHLSALKGGQLGAAARVPVLVLALSDVIGDDPATIASGPFSADPSTFADALAVTTSLGAMLPAAVTERLQRGASGQLPETPKPGDPRLAHVLYRVVAGPERVASEAREAIEARGLTSGVLSRNVGGPVEALAAAYVARAQREAAAGGPGRVLVGNGEPTIAVTPSAGAGGRSTHLALLVARGIAGLPGVTFLAAGTDDRDGSAAAAGAVVDGSTWPRAMAAGLAPQAALDGCDSARPLAALGCLVSSPGTSNLLDVHLLGLARGDRHDRRPNRGVPGVSTVDPRLI